MKRPDDDVLLKDMADHARMAVMAAAGKQRQSLDADPVLAAALERFIEVVVSIRVVRSFFPVATAGRHLLSDGREIG
jgi:hypothetical protein